MTNLLVGVAGNDVGVNIKGGATCHNNKQLLNTCIFVRNLIQILCYSTIERSGPSP